MNEKPVLLDTQALIEEASREFPVAKESSVAARLKDETESELRGIRRRLLRDNPFIENTEVLQNAEKDLDSKKPVRIGQLEQDLKHFESLAKQTGSRIDKKYWLLEIGKIKANQKSPTKQAAFKGRQKAGLQKPDSEKPDCPDEQAALCHTLLLQHWRKLLDEQTAKWELETIQDFRRKLLNWLKSWLEKLQMLADTLDDLSIETGRLFDLSKDNLSLTDIEQLKKWVSYISEDDGVKQLCDLMGRLRRAEKTKRQELVRTALTIKEYVPDVNSREEIVGVEWGKDIERAVPHEISLLADEETSVLFDVKLAEGRMMCFKMEGEASRDDEVEEERLTEVEEERAGPVIICVDTSGSMKGSPETIAKAVTLYMATRAVSQQRECFLISFSTGIETLDLSGDIGIAKVIEFLKRSFHGGTDVSPALTHALGVMEDRRYQRADLLVISDFIMASVPKPLHEGILSAKENMNRFYSLSIGDLFLSDRLKEIFDNEWVYDPSNSSIRSIQMIANSIEDPATT